MKISNWQKTKRVLFPCDFLFSLYIKWRKNDSLFNYWFSYTYIYFRTFSEIDWYLEENSTEDKTKAATNQIERLLNCFPNGVSRIDNFREDIEAIVEGYEAYLRILILSRQVFDHETKKLKTDEIYQKFISRLGSTTKSFQELFEFVNIRTYSEAICETIGSIMAIAVSNGRNLQSYNLDKELFIRFNMPPYHKVQDFISAVADDWRKRGNKQFYLKKSGNKLKMKTLSSSLSNFRSLEEKKSHFPLDLWDKKEDE